MTGGVDFWMINLSRGEDQEPPHIISDSGQSGFGITHLHFIWAFATEDDDRFYYMEPLCFF